MRFGSIVAVGVAELLRCIVAIASAAVAPAVVCVSLLFSLLVPWCAGQVCGREEKTNMDDDIA